jgi:hypothetical protein
MFSTNADARVPLPAAAPILHLHVAVGRHGSHPQVILLILGLALSGFAARPGQSLESPDGTLVPPAPQLIDSTSRIQRPAKIHRGPVAHTLTAATLASPNGDTSYPAAAVDVVTYHNDVGRTGRT